MRSGKQRREQILACSNTSHRRALIWQDTLVSLCFGRPPAIIIFDETPLPKATGSTEHPMLSFSDGCFHLFTIANKISQALLRTKPTDRLPIEAIRDFKNKIYRLEAHLAPHIQDYAKCQDFDDYVEHNVYRVLSDSVVLCLCRPAVLFQDDEQSQELLDTVLNRCRSVLRTYLELLRLECPTRRSWVYVHAALSCALTLGLTTNGKCLTTDGDLMRTFFDGVSQGTICANVSAYEDALGQLKTYLDVQGSH